MLQSLLSKIKAIAEENAIELKDVLVCKEFLLPDIEKRRVLIHSFRRYRNSTLRTDDILKDIYNVSLCESIASAGACSKRRTHSSNSPQSTTKRCRRPFGTLS